MKRDYATGEATKVKYFTGVEVENTPAKDKKTLFVVGVMASEEITAIATKHECNHVYLGANQSFDGYDLVDWDHMILELLRLGFWVTLDFDVKFCAKHPKWLKQLSEFDMFIPQISVKIPNITSYNNNTTIKIDDIDFKATNDGVWCHGLDKLKINDCFTGWEEYGNDEIIK